MIPKGKKIENYATHMKRPGNQSLPGVSSVGHEVKSTKGDKDKPASPNKYMQPNAPTNFGEEEMMANPDEMGGGMEEGMM
tara:strand:+ start:3316 stop:3555 length:240 start_codon:yes stop_codon:yes gene_type:complete